MDRGSWARSLHFHRAGKGSLQVLSVEGRRWLDHLYCPSFGRVQGPLSLWWEVVSWLPTFPPEFISSGEEGQVCLSPLLACLVVVSFNEGFVCACPGMVSSWWWGWFGGGGSPSIHNASFVHSVRGWKAVYATIDTYLPWQKLSLQKTYLSLLCLLVPTLEGLLLKKTLCWVCLHLIHTHLHTQVILP